MSLIKISFHSDNARDVLDALGELDKVELRDVRPLPPPSPPLTNLNQNFPYPPPALPPTPTVSPESLPLTPIRHPPWCS